MQCLKCGREAKGKEVFCPECLAVMAASPVKADTPVTLPSPDQLKRKPPTKKQPKAEEMIARLNTKVRRLRIAVAVLTILFAIAAGMLSYLLYQSYSTPAIGSNYNTVSDDMNAQ